MQRKHNSLKINHSIHWDISLIDLELVTNHWYLTKMINRNIHSDLFTFHCKVLSKQSQDIKKLNIYVLLRCRIIGVSINMHTWNELVGCIFTSPEDKVRIPLNLSVMLFNKDNHLIKRKLSEFYTTQFWASFSRSVEPRAPAS